MGSMATRTDHYTETAQVFLAQARSKLEAGDLVQASEKAWGAAAQSVKAAAERRGWRHQAHRDLFLTVERLADGSNDQTLVDLFQVASALHMNFYEGWQTQRMVERALTGIEAFVRRLEQLDD